MAVKTWSTPVILNEKRRIIPCTLCEGEAFAPYCKCSSEPDNAVFSYVRCTGCGLVQMNPQPETEAVRARYGKEYLSYETANESAFLHLQELALRDSGFFDHEKAILNASGGGRLLDIGCASGALIAALSKRGWTARGVEISQAQAEYCRSRGLEVSGLSLEENAFPGKSFDAALASHLIEHLNNPGAFVREVNRVLKQGGRFYVTTPNIAGFQARIFGAGWRSAIFDHLYLFSRTTLAALLERAGFRVERCRTWGGLAAGAAPKPVKAFFDRAVKILGAGDVMIMTALKI